ELNSPSTINSPHVSSVIHNHLQHVFKSFHTPTHPPYHLMINRAMKELNDKSGLTEEAISEFIRKEYDGDLPFAHETIFRIHLKKLCMSGELVCIDDGKYMLVSESEVVGATFESEEKDEEKEDENDERRKKTRRSII
ncbi:linker histone H1 and h5 family protein, partial [Trifolium pratense]